MLTEIKFKPDGRFLQPYVAQTGPSNPVITDEPGFHFLKTDHASYAIVQKYENNKATIMVMVGDTNGENSKKMYPYTTVSKTVGIDLGQELTMRIKNRELIEQDRKPSHTI